MKGILFKPYHIPLVMDGTKTETRRLVKPPLQDDCRWHEGAKLFIVKGSELGLIRKPRYLPGETVYLKEAWAAFAKYDNCKPSDIPTDSVIWFQDTVGIYSTEKGYKQGKQRSPMFLPERFARTFLLIKSVLPQRLQDITEEEAMAEGIYSNSIYKDCCFHWESKDSGYETARIAYRALWDSINKLNTWASNPWVFAYKFEEGKW